MICRILVCFHGILHFAADNQFVAHQIEMNFGIRKCSVDLCFQGVVEELQPFSFTGIGQHVDAIAEHDLLGDIVAVAEPKAQDGDAGCAPFQRELTGIMADDGVAQDVLIGDLNQERSFLEGQQPG